MKNKNSIKENYNNLKEAWKDPRKKAGIKLLSYFIFFFILMLFASISSRLTNDKENYTKTTTTTTTKLVDKYKDKQKELLTNKFNINYVININNIEYKINGTLENNVVNGYLEMPEGIKKIIIKENFLYEIINNEEKILETNINSNLISVSYIINLIKQNSAIISDIDNIKTYSYDVKDIAKIDIKTNETSIIEINIIENNNSYLLNFDI